MPNLIQKVDTVTGLPVLELIKQDELESSVLEYLVSAFATLMLATNSIQPGYDPVSYELTWEVIRKALGGIQETVDGLIVGTDPLKATKVDDNNNVVVDINGVSEATTVTNADQLLVNIGGTLKKVSLWNLLKSYRNWYSVTEAALPGKAETYEWALKLTQLRADGFGDNLNVKIGTAFSCYGKISHIGGSGADPDWSDFKNRYLLLTAGGNGWFGLSNAGLHESAPAYTKPIRNNQGIELHGLRKALLYYDEDYDSGQGAWIVLSYETISYSDRFTISETAFAAGGVSVEIPNIKVEGYYLVTISVGVEERWWNGLAWEQAVTGSPQTLTISDVNGSEAYTVFTSVNGGGTGGAAVYIFNNSLQGTCKIRVTGDVIADRKWSVTANLPNPDEGRITGGYLHCEYLGYLEAD